jgi:hypothetical protein
LALHPRARSSGGGGGGGIHCSGSVEEEVALEEQGEVPEVSRRLHLKGTVGAEASNPSAGIKALAQCSTAK